MISGGGERKGGKGKERDRKREREGREGGTRRKS